jgi:hypothetical protein
MLALLWESTASCTRLEAPYRLEHFNGGPNSSCTNYRWSRSRCATWSELSSRPLIWAGAVPHHCHLICDPQHRVLIPMPAQITLGSLHSPCMLGHALPSLAFIPDVGPRHAGTLLTENFSVCCAKLFGVLHFFHISPLSQYDLRLPVRLCKCCQEHLIAAHVRCKRR